MCPILTVLLLILFVQGYKPQWLTAPSNGRGKGLRAQGYDIIAYRLLSKFLQEIVNLISCNIMISLNTDPYTRFQGQFDIV